MRPAGIAERGMENTVFVPVGIIVPTPILVTPHGGVVIKILNFKSDEAGTRGGNGAVQKEFICH